MPSWFSTSAAKIWNHVFSFFIFFDKLSCLFILDVLILLFVLGWM